MIHNYLAYVIYLRTFGTGNGTGRPGDVVAFRLLGNDRGAILRGAT